MPIEIEKKYRLNKRQYTALQRLLSEIGAQRGAEEFEENTLYQGDALDARRCVLRLRRIDSGRDAILTFKERIPSRSSIKHQQEDETHVSEPAAVVAIFRALGLTPALVYEKRRTTWRLGDAELMIDELPFGLFLEIEASEAAIRKIQRRLKTAGLDLAGHAEQRTYPHLAAHHGRLHGSIIEARFDKGRRTRK